MSGMFYWYGIDLFVVRSIFEDKSIVFLWKSKCDLLVVFLEMK